MSNIRDIDLYIESRRKRKLIFPKSKLCRLSFKRDQRVLLTTFSGWQESCLSLCPRTRLHGFSSFHHSVQYLTSWGSHLSSLWTVTRFLWAVNNEKQWQLSLWWMNFVQRKSNCCCDLLQNKLVGNWWQLMVGYLLLTPMGFLSLHWIAVASMAPVSDAQCLVYAYFISYESYDPFLFYATNLFFLYSLRHFKPLSNFSFCLIWAFIISSVL